MLIFDSLFSSRQSILYDADLTQLLLSFPKLCSVSNTKTFGYANLELEHALDVGDFFLDFFNLMNSKNVSCKPVIYI